MSEQETIVSKLSLEGKITEQHAKEIEEIIETYFEKRLKEILPEKKLLDDELTEEEKEVMIKLFGDYKTPEHIRERRYGYNNCIEDILNNK